MRAFFAQFTMDASLRASEISSNAMCVHALTEFTFEFTSHVRDQVIHGTCPVYPNQLKHRQDVFWRSGTQTLVRLSPPAQRDPLLHLD